MSRRVPRSRAPLALALGAALAVPLTLTPPATAADSYTVTPLKFTVQAGGRPCTVDADLYRPAGVDRDRRAPAVLGTNGFGGSKSDGSTDTIGKAFAQRGYVSLIYSGLGFGRSGCLISLDDPDIDGAAASRLVDFLGGKRAADDGTTADYVALDRPGDPRVGMIGGSYGGAVQLATAAVDHRLDALVPMITWNDLAYALDPNNATGSTGVPASSSGSGPTVSTSSARASRCSSPASTRPVSTPSPVCTSSPRPAGPSTRSIPAAIPPTGPPSCSPSHAASPRRRTSTASRHPPCWSRGRPTPSSTSTRRRRRTGRSAHRAPP
ncbi:hypothetical protein GCM10011428_33510 [Streptomyces violaceus]